MPAAVVAAMSAFEATACSMSKTASVFFWWYESQGYE